MAALCEMKLNLQLAKREGTWLLWGPEAEIPLAYEEELEDEDGQEILRQLGRWWTRPQRVLVRYDALSHTVLSYLCEIVQRASERSYLGKRGLKILIPFEEENGGQPVGAGHGERLGRGGAKAVVPRAPQGRGLLQDPAGAPRQRPDPKGQADAAAAPPTRRASPRSGP